MAEQLSLIGVVLAEISCHRTRSRRGQTRFNRTGTEELERWAHPAWSRSRGTPGPGHKVSAIAARRRVREEAESRRLLYVAVTRARDAVILSASGLARPGSLLALLTPGLQAAGVELREVPAPDPVPAPLSTALWTEPVGLRMFEETLMADPSRPEE